jgi:hypothetical protein
MDYVRRFIKWGGILAGVSLFVIVYKVYNPYEYSFFPKCPFLELTGFQCPGCGSQRAIHFLLNLDIYHAFQENALLVISIPYIILGFIFESIQKPSSGILRWRNVLFGRNATYCILVIIIGFWILRNLV